MGHTAANQLVGEEAAFADLGFTLRVDLLARLFGPIFSRRSRPSVRGSGPTRCRARAAVDTVLCPFHVAVTYWKPRKVNRSMPCEHR